MKKRKIIIAVVAVLVCLAIACCGFVAFVVINLRKDAKEQAQNNALSQEVIDEWDTSENMIMDTSYGQIKFYDGVYHYSVYGKNNEVIEQGESIHLPKITLLNDSLLEFSLQTGTGLQTQWGFYYDFEQNIKSNKFTCVYDTFNENVVYGDIDKIVIRNIFDVNKYYYEIPLSTIPLSNTVVEPITDIKFADEGQIIKVTYYSDVDNSEATQELKLT